MYVNPYANLTDARPLRVNFHTHAGTGPNTCGRNPIDQVAERYRELGYDALCLSNHDLYTDASSYTDDKMTLLDGVEYSPRAHMLTVGIRRSLHELEHQPAIDETRKDGGFVILCHPNWQHKEYWPWADLDRLTGYLGIEVINQLIYRLSGSGLAADTWDHLLSSGRLVYGFGNDDFHLYSDAGRSWNWIYAPSPAYPDIREAEMCIRDRHSADPEQHLRVFNPDSIYLPTKKIGKNNPKAAEIEAAQYNSWKTSNLSLTSLYFIRPSKYREIL